MTIKKFYMMIHFIFMHSTLNMFYLFVNKEWVGREFEFQFDFISIINPKFHQWNSNFYVKLAPVSSQLKLSSFPKKKPIYACHIHVNACYLSTCA